MSSRFTRRKLLSSVVASAVGVSGCQTSSLFDRTGDDTVSSTAMDTATGTGREQTTGGSIQVSTRSLVGDPLRVRLAGFEPNTPVSLEASAIDTVGDEYAKTWSLQTGNDGTAAISVSETTPTRSASTWIGTDDRFRTPDPSGLSMVLHTLRPATDSPRSKPFVIDNAAEVTLDARVGAEKRPRTTQTTIRVYTNSAVTRQPVEADGLVGELYLPPSSGPRPAVVTLHGSGGYLPRTLSEMLATHGYVTLALKYFGRESSDSKGLPSTLSGVSVEYFQRAIRWLTTHEEVRNTSVGFVGLSRGVEPALLAAADYDGPASVIGYSGSGMVAGEYPVEGRPESAWLRNEEPIAPYDAVETVLEFVWSLYQSNYELSSVPERIRNSLSAATLERVLIPVEKIDGPILLFVGENDLLWPAPLLSMLAIDRLKRRGHPYSYGLRSYTSAGHTFVLPYRSYEGHTTDTHGGTPVANARAAAAAWPQLLMCLKRSTHRATLPS